MKKQYIYIDDDKQENSLAKVKGFTNNNIGITAQQHQDNWEIQMEVIQKVSDTIDGIILDLGLGDIPNENDVRANFRGTSLAQEIRTRQKEGIIKSFPIILFSGNDKLTNLLDTTGSDLFDLCIDKEKIDDSAIFEGLSDKLYALAEGYRIITAHNKQSDDSLNIILNVETANLDERFTGELKELLNSPTHIIASFIINELIGHQGLLIDTATLAARLGISIYESEDWSKLIEQLKFARYEGVFSQGWERWWMPLIEEWWDKTFSSESLRILGAPERVSLLKAKYNLSELHVAEKIRGAESDAFWTVCHGYNTPIDPIDGLIIGGQDRLYPWQEPDYVSIDAALRRKNVSNWKNVAETEKDFLNTLIKQSLKQ